MKQTFFLIFFSLFSIFLGAQNEKQFFDLIINKEYSQAGTYFNPQIDVCIGNFEAKIEKKDAVFRMTDFFNKNNPVSYTVKHKGDSMGMKSSYYVLDLKTSNGPYRMFVYFDKTAGSLRISEFRLEKS